MKSFYKVTMAIQSSPSIPIPAKNEEEAAQIARSVLMQVFPGSLSVEVDSVDMISGNFQSFAGTMNCFPGSGKESGGKGGIFACDGCPSAHICSNETKAMVLRHLAEVEYLKDFSHEMQSQRFLNEADGAGRESDGAEVEEKEIPDYNSVTTKIMELFNQKLRAIEITYGDGEQRGKEDQALPSYIRQPCGGILRWLRPLKPLIFEVRR